MNPWREVEHGDHCDCVLLARAIGVAPSAVDFRYCHEVLQRHWRVSCNHGWLAPAPAVTPRLPPFDLQDPVQAALLANLPV